MSVTAYLREWNLSTNMQYNGDQIPKAVLYIFYSFSALPEKVFVKLSSLICDSLLLEGKAGEDRKALFDLE